MPKRELFKIDFCKIIKFDCKCGRRYINTSNCRQCTDSYEKQTNADRIRSMDNEELLDFLCSIQTYDDGSVKTIENGSAMCSVSDIEEWLESEVSE